jgi:hypothetical protein
MLIDHLFYSVLVLFFDAFNYMYVLYVCTHRRIDYRVDFDLNRILSYGDAGLGTASAAVHVASSASTSRRARRWSALPNDDDNNDDDDCDDDDDDDCDAEEDDWDSDVVADDDASDDGARRAGRRAEPPPPPLPIETGTARDGNAPGPLFNASPLLLLLCAFLFSGKPFRLFKSDSSHSEAQACEPGDFLVQSGSTQWFVNNLVFNQNYELHDADEGKKRAKRAEYKSHALMRGIRDNAGDKGTASTVDGIIMPDSMLVGSECSCHVLLCCSLARNTNLTSSNATPFLQCIAWLWILCAAVFYNMFFVTYRMAFDPRLSRWWIFLLDYTSDRRWCECSL